jgi:adenosylcobinamide-phosphate synthase
MATLEPPALKPIPNLRAALFTIKGRVKGQMTDMLEHYAALHMPLAALAAVLLDRLLGEARRWHPLVGFGRLADGIERVLNRGKSPRVRGALAWSLAVLPPVALALCWSLSSISPLSSAGVWLLDVLLCYFALGARSLSLHAQAVQEPLAAGDLATARRRVGFLVSRDVHKLDAADVARAGVESVLENGNDAVFAALFWFALLGGPGALFLRLTNTLDAMWGYKNVRFFHFGTFAARMDDAANWLPARLTALTYALLGAPSRAFFCWRTQAGAWESPNAGPVMAAGAGSLGVRLGGAAIYEGREEPRPFLGEGVAPDHRHINAALALVRRGLWLWLGVLFVIGACRVFFTLRA